MKRFVPLGVLLAILVVLYLLGLQHYLSFDMLRNYHQELQGWAQLYPVLFPLGFMLVYAACVAVSLPAAAWLSLLGGYLFPQPLSAIYVIIAATTGATILFLAAKTAFGNLWKKRSRPFLKKMGEGFRKDGASYLLFLRFVPLFPFWAVNLVPAFFGIPLRTFVWTTAVGITPGAIGYTLAGSGLGNIFETKGSFALADVFNTELVVALVLLGCLSLLSIFLKRFKK